MILIPAVPLAHFVAVVIAVVTFVLVAVLIAIVVAIMFVVAIAMPLRHRNAAGEQECDRKNAELSRELHGFLPEWGRLDFKYKTAQARRSAMGDALCRVENLY
jgi:MFS superfamily sulfate permease-like transporter